MKRWKLIMPAVLIAIAALLNLIARLSREFSNFYVNHIFPLWVETYGRVTGLFPFSVGEWMLYLAVCLVGILLLGGIMLLFVRKCFPNTGSLMIWKSFYKKYAVFMYWVFGIVCVIMTLNCFLLYQASPITQRHQLGEGTRESYGVEELTVLRNYVVEQANALSTEFARDENGYILYEGNMKEEAIRQMKRLGEQFPELSGYYPAPKELFASGFYSQQYIMGYYFPFSMEANYNGQMYVTNMPVTMCHELSHLKGFILEDEANFIGYLACVDSEDAFFRYSAYLSVMGYLDRDFIKAVGEETQVYQKQPQISELAASDKKFLTREAWQQVEERAVVSTETVKQATDTFLNTTLTLNGVADGTVSYSRVVKLLLQYYDGILY